MNRANNGYSETGTTGNGSGANGRRGEDVRRPTFLAPVDVYETGEEIVVVADVPGATSESVDVNYEDQTLTIRAGVGPRGPEGGRSLLNEYGVGDYARSLRIGQPMDLERASATLTGGVLTLRLPKTAESRARKIRVGEN